jgi:polyisoprenoid-binding protein YceI
MFKGLFLWGSIVGVMLWQPSIAADSSWTIDPAHSSAQFSIRHMMISNVTGDFGRVSGSANYDGTNIDKASVDATIPVANINTREPQRDQHLKSPDFFDIEKYPTITFKSTKIESAGNGQFKMTGDLTMHGVTKTVVLEGEGPTPEIKDTRGKIRIGASATTSLKRKDYGINYNQVLDNGGAMVGDDVKVTINLELVKGPGPKPAASMPKSGSESL